MMELENMPNHYSHTIYKHYIEMLKDAEQQKAHAAEEMKDEIEDAAGV